MPGQGISRRRKTLPRQYRVGALAKADQRARDIRHAAGRLQQLVETDHAGKDQMPITLQSVAERFAFVEFHLAALEAKAWNGEAIDWQRYFGLSTALTRLADRLGYVRRARPVENLHQYMARKSAEAEAVPAATAPSTGGDGSP